MKSMFEKLSLAFVLGLSLMCSTQAADDDKPVKRDNTKVNERDKTPDRVTADQQGQSKEDIATTANIRKAVMEDKSLSTNAHNVKIITLNSMVTLRGPVKNETEKAAIEKLAIEKAGKDFVKNEIEIAP